jgi:hypothetical protein
MKAPAFKLPLLTRIPIRGAAEVRPSWRPAGLAGGVQTELGLMSPLTIARYQLLRTHEERMRYLRDCDYIYTAAQWFRLSSTHCGLPSLRRGPVIAKPSSHRRRDGWRTATSRRASIVPIRLIWEKEADPSEPYD